MENLRVFLKQKQIPFAFILTVIAGISAGTPITWALYKWLIEFMPEPCFLVVGVLASILGVYSFIAQNTASGILLQIQMGLITGICLSSNLGLLQIFATGSIFSLVMILVGLPLELFLISWMLSGMEKNSKYSMIPVTVAGEQTMDVSEKAALMV